MKEPSPESPGRPWIPATPNKKNDLESVKQNVFLFVFLPGGPGGPLRPGLYKKIIHKKMLQL